MRERERVGKRKQGGKSRMKKTGIALESSRSTAGGNFR
jgi:hypothetical protein